MQWVAHPPICCLGDTLLIMPSLESQTGLPATVPEFSLLRFPPRNFTRQQAEARPNTVLPLSLWLWSPAPVFFFFLVIYKIMKPDAEPSVLKK